MAMTGNDMPEMLNEITPQSEAKLSPSRSVGRAANMNTPSPCAATTPSAETPSITGNPHRQGKRSQA